MWHGSAFRIFFLFLLLTPVAAAIAAVPRPGVPTGKVVTANGDESIQFISEANWRNVEVEQDLLTGDRLRTGPNGALALRFIDQTLIRVHRNSELVVKNIGGGTKAEIDLSLGQIWARALKGGDGVDVTTPSATAAIKGTDWSMSVDPNGRTTLVVLDGVVNLSNQFGAVDVAAGEAAIAEIGRAPNKIILAQPPGREQMLYYLQARGMFWWLPVNDLSSQDERARRQALRTQEEGSLSAEERVELAELAYHFDGEAQSMELLRPLGDGQGLSDDMVARIALLHALSAGLKSDWDSAINLFEAADRGLSGRRQLSARTGKYLSLILSGKAAEAREYAPQVSLLPTDAYQILVKAWFQAVAGDMPEASKTLLEAEPMYPNEPLLPVLRGNLAVALGDEAQAREAFARAAEIDPKHQSVLTGQAGILSDFEFDMRGARAKLQEALEIAPGYADAWNNLGLVLEELEDFPGAERAHLTGIALDPYGSHQHSNYARFLVIHNELDKAKPEVDIAEKLDPGNFAALQVEGAWLMAQDRLEEAGQVLLGSVAANPTVASSSVLLAIAYYQSGQYDAAIQTLDDAARLDPNDPQIALVKTVIALNDSRAGEAIRNARQAYRLYLQQGRLVSPLAAARSTGSYLFSAFSNLSLNDWGRAYGDYSFNPFDASTQFYQASAPVTTVVADGSDRVPLNFNSALQGLAIDPLTIAGRSRYIDLVRRPFFDPVMGGGGTIRDGDSDGWLSNATFSAFTNQGQPVSLFASLDYEDNGTDANNALNRSFAGSAFFGTEFDLRNRLFVFGQAQSFHDDLPRAQSLFPELSGAEDEDSTAYITGAGYSYRFGADNVLLALAGAAGQNQDFDVNLEGGIDFDGNAQQDGGFASLAHYYSDGAVTLRYGIEGEVDNVEQRQELAISGFTLPDFTIDDNSTQSSARFFSDAIVQFNPRLSMEVGLNLSRFDDDFGSDATHLDPRVGAGWLFAEGQWLRAAYRQDTTLSLAGSLAPVATIGLTPVATPTAAGGQLKTAIVRWDAEWSDRFFTALEYQHQEIDDYSASWLDSPILLTLPVVAKGDLDIVTLSANAWVLEELGLFGVGSLIDSDNESGEGDLPLIPEWQASFGATWVSPIDLRVTVTENLVGSRPGDLEGNRLSSFATTDVSVAWQPFDRHIQLSAGVRNLFDEDYHIAHDVRAPGRVFTINGEIRF